MRHKWNYDYTPPNADLGTLLMGGPWRQCIHCKVVQEKTTQYSWGRVVGYSWYPKLGLCCDIKKDEK